MWVRVGVWRLVGGGVVGATKTRCGRFRKNLAKECFLGLAFEAADGEVERCLRL